MIERPTARAALFIASLALPAAAQPAESSNANTWEKTPNPAPAAPAAPSVTPAAATPTPAPAETTPTEPTAASVKDAPAAPAPATTSPGAGSMSATAAATPNPTTPPGRAPLLDEQPDDRQMGSHRDHLVGTLGVRNTYVTNSGFDAFSTNNALTQLSLGVGSTLSSNDRFAFAALLFWDWGQTEAEARGADASLDVHRLTVAAEGRYHLLRRLYVFGRVAPGTVHWSAALEDRVAGLERSDDRWVFATDLSAGAAFEFAGQDRGESKRPRGWVSADGGYGWSAASDVTLDPDGENSGPQRSQPIALGDLGLRGGFFRVALALTY